MTESSGDGDGDLDSGRVEEMAVSCFVIVSRFTILGNMDVACVSDCLSWKGGLLLLIMSFFGLLFVLLFGSTCSDGNLSDDKVEWESGDDENLILVDTERSGGLLDVDVVVEESGEVNFILAGKEIGVGLLGLGVFPRLTGTGTLPCC